MEDKAFEAIVGHADTIGHIAKAAGIKSLTVAIDPQDNIARCEFVCSDADLANLVSAVFSTAARQLPVEQIGDLIEQVQRKVTFNLFDPRGPAYRPPPGGHRPQGKPPRKGRR